MMKKLAILSLLICSALSVTAAEAQWLTDLPTAQTKAKAGNKMILLDFTGSDWCGWCIKFNKEVLSTDEFKEYAAKNLVLVEVDFPHKPQGAGLKKANRALQQKYKADGFPTFVVLSKEGKQIGRQEGYEAGGPKAFIAKLEEFKKKS
jgi:thioredoxin-related protein